MAPTPGENGHIEPPDDRPRVGTGKVFPTKFVPESNKSPFELFTPRKRHMEIFRYTLPDDHGTGLILASGACKSNGQNDASMGWAFYDGCLDDGTPHVTAYRLEKKGRFDHDKSETNNRAKLRAVIDALRNQFWPGEGFHTMVIAINSQYVVGGATTWVKEWMENGWMKSSTEERKNKDLWKALLREVERCNDQGMAVKLWEIPKKWNKVAHKAAYKVAREAPK